MSRSSLKYGLVVVVFAASPITARADCGFFGCILNDVIPGAGDAADSWHRQWKERDSDASVASQVEQFVTPDTSGFRSARPGQQGAPPPPPPPGYYQQGYGQGVGLPPVYLAPAAVPTYPQLSNVCETSIGLFALRQQRPLGSGCSIISQGQRFVGWIILH
jgi:hypothetical protein